MSDHPSHHRALEGITVLELPDVLTGYAGKLLADLGAEVILIEPPGGCGLRRRPPFGEGVPGEDAIPFHYWATSKASVTLDLSSRRGAQLFAQLAGRAHLVLDALTPRATAAMSADFDDLARRYPHLCRTNVTPFGATGPYADYQATDLVALAMGGLLQMGGYADGEPYQAGGEQAYMATNIYAAAGSLLALFHARRTGEGQRVDVSMQESVTMALENAIQYYDQESHIRRRWGGTQRSAGQGVFPCKDGYVLLLAGGIAASRFWDPFVRWMSEGGAVDALLLDDERWRERKFVESDEARAVFQRVFDSYAAQRTKQELYQEAQEIGVPLCPVNDVTEVCASPQLQAREYFATFVDPGRGLTLRVPGAPYKHGRTPAVPGPAPLLGQDTARVLDRVGVSERELADLSLEGIVS